MLKMNKAQFKVYAKKLLNEAIVIFEDEQGEKVTFYSGNENSLTSCVFGVKVCVLSLINKNNGSSILAIIESDNNIIGKLSFANEYDKEKNEIVTGAYNHQGKNIKKYLEL